MFDYEYLLSSDFENLMTEERSTGWIPSQLLDGRTIILQTQRRSPSGHLPQQKKRPLPELQTLKFLGQYLHHVHILRVVVFPPTLLIRSLIKSVSFDEIRF